MRRRVILAAFFLLAMISVGASLYIDFHLSRNSPKEPKPDEGRVYSAVVNKVPVYLTGRELAASYLPAYSFLVWFAAALYFGVRWRAMPVATRAPKPGVQLVTNKKKDSG